MDRCQAAPLGAANLINSVSGSEQTTPKLEKVKSSTNMKTHRTDDDMTTGFSKNLVIKTGKTYCAKPICLFLRPDNMEKSRIHLKIDKL